MPKDVKEDKNGECPPAFKKINPWIKFAIGIFSLVLLVGGVVWGSINTFAMKPEVIAVKVESEKARVLLAEKSVETFNMFQKSYQNDQIRIDIRNYNQLVEDSRRRERYVRDDLVKKPNDQVLKNRLQEELDLQRRYREKIDELLSN